MQLCGPLLCISDPGNVYCAHSHSLTVCIAHLRRCTIVLRVAEVEGEADGKYFMIIESGNCCSES